MKEKILVLGSSGLVGQNLVKKLDEFNIFTTSHTKKTFESDLSFDITLDNSIEKLFDLVKPDVVVNLCNIYNNLEFCEKNKELVNRVNGESLKIISKNANRVDSHIITLSSDFVFDGKVGNYKETDEVNPINFYGQTKASGENYVQELGNSFCIARTSMVFGKNNLRKTLPEHILEGIKNNQKYRLIDDQFMTPTYLDYMCLMLKEIINNQIQGIIHLVGKTKTTRYEFGLELCKILNFDKNLLIPVSRDEFTFSRFMPKDSSLNSEKASRLLHEKPRELHIAIQSYQEESNQI